MPAWWTPDITHWLLPAALAGVPVIAGGIVALGQGMTSWLHARARRHEENAARDIATGSIAYRLVAIVFVLAGLFEWGIGTSQAVLAQTLIVDHPAEFWRWINAVIGPVIWGGVLCGCGVHTVRTWRRLLTQQKSP